VTNARSLAIACALLLAVSGCGQGGAKVAQPAENSENFNDWRYHQSLMGFTDAGYRSFLKGLDPADRAHYIQKAVDDNPPISLYTYKGIFEQYSSDPNPDVAAAAKEAVSKCPSAEEYETLKKEAKEKMQEQFAKGK
jgi:hypothetical protein